LYRYIVPTFLAASLMLSCHAAPPPRSLSTDDAALERELARHPDAELDLGPAPAVPPACRLTLDSSRWPGAWQETRPSLSPDGGSATSGVENYEAIETDTGCRAQVMRMTDEPAIAAAIILNMRRAVSAYMDVSEGFGNQDLTQCFFLAESLDPPLIGIGAVRTLHDACPAAAVSLMLICPPEMVDRIFPLHDALLDSVEVAAAPGTR
jgi:hypothetical protein